MAAYNFLLTQNNDSYISVDSALADVVVAVLLLLPAELIAGADGVEYPCLFLFCCSLYSVSNWGP
jgi:hypothetical protein